MAIPISIIVTALKNNPDETPSDEEVKRDLEESRVIFWEYFILIIPVILISIGLLSNDFDEKQNSLATLTGLFTDIAVDMRMAAKKENEQSMFPSGVPAIIRTN
jgi:hypothetical protein